MKLTRLFFSFSLPLLLATSVSMAQVTPEMLVDQSKSPGDWLHNQGNAQGYRYSPLQQINKTNISRLRPAWTFQNGKSDKFEATPIAVGGILYVSDPPSDVTALESRSGKVLWKYKRVLPDGVPFCCGRVNRGVAVHGNRVFIGTLDAHLVALDASTGNVLWDVPVIDYRKGYSSTVSPLVVKDNVVIGSAGGEFGARGYLAAYNVKTGKEAWRTWTIPGAGEKGTETWLGDSYKYGSGTTWVTGSYDPGLNTIYWGTGNPGPDWKGDKRKGDNLYSNSLLALDGDTGKMKWYFQFTPHDVHDLDSTQVPILADEMWNGKMRKLVYFANRNAFYYVLDRETGEYLMGKQYVRQTWAQKELDPNGRPIKMPNTEPTEKGTLVYPNSTGATNFQAPSYSPKTKLHYVMTRDEGGIYYSGDDTYKEGSWYIAGRFISAPGEEAKGAIKAMDPKTGTAKWEYSIGGPSWTGVLSTAGGLVFSATGDGEIIALDDTTGKLLWKYPMGGAPFGNPMSYIGADGKQHIAITSGQSLFSFTID